MFHPESRVVCFPFRDLFHSPNKLPLPLLQIQSNQPAEIPPNCSVTEKVLYTITHQVWNDAQQLETDLPDVNRRTTQITDFDGPDLRVRRESSADVPFVRFLNFFLFALQTALRDI